MSSTKIINNLNKVIVIFSIITIIFKRFKKNKQESHLESVEVYSSGKNQIVTQYIR